MSNTEHARESLEAAAVELLLLIDSASEEPFRARAARSLAEVRAAQRSAAAERIRSRSERVLELADDLHRAAAGLGEVESGARLVERLAEIAEAARALRYALEGRDGVEGAGL